MKVTSGFFSFLLAILLSFVMVRFVVWYLPGTLADYVSSSETTFQELDALRIELSRGTSIVNDIKNFFLFSWGTSFLYQSESLPVILKHFALTFRFSSLALLLTIFFVAFYFLFKRKTAYKISAIFLALPALALFPFFVFVLCEYSAYCPAGATTMGPSLFFAALAQGLLTAPRFYRELEWELDHIRTQRFVLVLKAKGLSPFVIWTKHIFRNAAGPLLSLTLLSFLGLLSGTVLIEALFDLPGIGMLLLEAIRARDFALMFPLVMFLSLLHLVSLRAGRFLKRGRALFV